MTEIIDYIHEAVGEDSRLDRSFIGKIFVQLKMSSPAMFVPLAEKRNLFNGRLPDLLASDFRAVHPPWSEMENP